MRIAAEHCKSALVNRAYKFEHAHYAIRSFAFHNKVFALERVEPPILENVHSRTAHSSNFLRLVAVASILALSVQLVRIKIERSRLRGEAEDGIHEFVQGMELPSLPVRDFAGSVVLLNSFCDGRTPLVVLLTKKNCSACEELTPLLSTLSVKRRDVRFVLIYADRIPAGVNRSDDYVTLRSALPSALASVAHVHSAPAAWSTDSQCRLLSAGAGTAAGRAVLEQLLPVDAH